MANETVSSDVVEKTGAVEKTDVGENVVKNVVDDSLEAKILKQVEVSCLNVLVWVANNGFFLQSVLL